MTKAIEPTGEDRRLMGEAFSLAAKCERSGQAFSVGAIIADFDRQILATGYSRELGKSWHAEEVAIHKARESGVDLENCILYSTLEPCGERISRSTSCSRLIAASGIPVLMYAVAEPNTFVEAPRGSTVLTGENVSVSRLEGFEERFLADNLHIVGGTGLPH